MKPRWTPWPTLLACLIGRCAGPYSPKAEQYSQAFCEGDLPGVQDADHAYDLRHDSTMGLIGVHTYYAQALLKCSRSLRETTKTHSSSASWLRTARFPKIGTRAVRCWDSRNYDLHVRYERRLLRRRC